MLGSSRQFVELNDDDDLQPVAACCTLRNAKLYFNKIQRQRPVFLAMQEALCPKLFYGWVVVFACGLGWWCVAPAATFGVGVYVDYWLSDPGAACAQAFVRIPYLLFLLDATPKHYRACLFPSHYLHFFPSHYLQRWRFRYRAVFYRLTGRWHSS